MARIGDIIPGLGKSTAQINEENRVKKQIKDQNEYNKEVWRYGNRIGKQERETAVELQEIQKRAIDRQIRSDEIQLIQNFEDAMEFRAFEQDLANQYYQRSVSQAAQQKQYNQMAANAAREQQAVKFHEDMLGLAFEKGRSVLDYYGNSTGLKVNRHNALVQADFREAAAENRFRTGMAQKQNAKRQVLSESQHNAQKAIVEGLKAAGTLRARGQAGRSSVKAVLGVMAESGAMRAGIADALMYAENSLDLDIAELKDIQILEQTMVLAARDSANMAHDFGQSKLDFAFDLDNLMFSETEKSIKRRDQVVKKQINNALMLADMQADHSIMLEPQLGPMPKDPRTSALAAFNDDPTTLDYIELLPRPEFIDIPEYQEPPEPEEISAPASAPSFDFGRFLGSVGTIAGGLATAGSGLAASAASSKFLGLGASSWGQMAAVSRGLTSFGGGFPR